MRDREALREYDEARRRMRPWEYGYRRHLDWKREFSMELFGDEHYLDGVGFDIVEDIFRRCSGKDPEVVAAVARDFAEKREARRAVRGEKTERWVGLRERFGGAVLGIDPDVKTHANGFSVRVILRSDMPFGERVGFVRENRRDFLVWLIGELGECKRAVKRIGDSRFYQPVEITCLRSAEVEVKFEVKGEKNERFA